MIEDNRIISCETCICEFLSKYLFNLSIYFPRKLTSTRFEKTEKFRKTEFLFIGIAKAIHAMRSRVNIDHKTNESFGT